MGVDALKVEDAGFHVGKSTERLIVEDAKFFFDMGKTGFYLGEEITHAPDRADDENEIGNDN